MKNRILGTLALMGAPALLLGMHLEQVFPVLANSWFTGAWGLIYISGWMASILALRRMQATGTSSFGKRTLQAITGALVLANLSNVLQLVAPQDKSTLFFILDSFWPISNLLMLGVGILVIKAHVLSGWHRFVPLVAGLWFPLTALGMVLLGRDAPVMVLVPYYSALAWTLLALVVLTSKEKPRSKKRKSAVKVLTSIHYQSA